MIDIARIKDLYQKGYTPADIASIEMIRYWAVLYVLDLGPDTARKRKDRA